jgi:DNA-directed RNA polymerase subunit RPC12/RpoP
MSTIVRHTRDHRGMKHSECPRCHTLFVYWDPEDLDENGDLRCFCDRLDETQPGATCQHCGRAIFRDVEGIWVDPEATGDDEVWRETCDEHDTFMAEHEPEEAG